MIGKLKGVRSRFSLRSIISEKEPEKGYDKEHKTGAKGYEQGPNNNTNQLNNDNDNDNSSNINNNISTQLNIPETVREIDLENFTPTPASTRTARANSTTTLPSSKLSAYESSLCIHSTATAITPDAPITLVPFISPVTPTVPATHTSTVASTLIPSHKPTHLHLLTSTHTTPTSNRTPSSSNSPNPSATPSPNSISSHDNNTNNNDDMNFSHNNRGSKNNLFSLTHAGSIGSISSVGSINTINDNINDNHNSDDNTMPSLAYPTLTYHTANTLNKPSSFLTSPRDQSFSPRLLDPIRNPVLMPVLDHNEAPSPISDPLILRSQSISPRSPLVVRYICVIYICI